MNTNDARDLSFMEDFDKFKALADRGRQFMVIGCQKLMAAGVKDVEFPAGLPPMRDRNDFAAIAEYSAHEQDSTIRGLVCEWKSRDYLFTCPEDFPFETVFIDTVNSIDLKEKMPDYYIFICQKNLAITAINVNETREWWRVEWAHDRVRGYGDRFYTCPRKLLLDEKTLISRLLMS